MDEIIDIVVVTYNRRHLLQQTLEGIFERTETPYRLIVIDNHSTEDDTVDYLKTLKEAGKIDVLILCEKNIGLAPAYTLSMDYVESEYFVCANDDLVVPDLSPDWLIQLKNLFDKYYPEYGAITLRCAKLKNVHFNNTTTITWLPYDEIGEAKRSIPALFRMQKKSDVDKAFNKFGTQGGYNDEYQCKKMMNKLGMRSGFARDLWCNHVGFALENRGYPGEFKEYAGCSEARNEKNLRVGYPEVDPKTNVPFNIKHV